MNDVKIVWTPEKKERAIEILTIYFQKYTNGEVIRQCDGAIIEAPEMLADIADKVLVADEGIIIPDEWYD